MILVTLSKQTLSLELNIVVKNKSKVVQRCLYSYRQRYLPSQWSKFVVGSPCFASWVHIILAIQYILNWPLPIGAFQGQWNTTATSVKNPNWPEANLLAIYKITWEVEPGTTRIKFTEWSERVLNPGSPDLEESALTTGPHCLSLTTVVTHIVVDKRTDNAEQLSICELEHSTSRMFDANDISVLRIVSMGSLRSTTRRQRKRHKFCIFN